MIRTLALAALLTSAAGGAADGATEGAVESTAQIPYDTLTSTDGRITVLSTAAASERARSLMDFFSASAPLPGLPAELPTEAEVVLAPSEAAFTEAVGGRVPEWGAAVAIPSERRIVLPGYGSPRGRWNEPRTLRHEWAHLGLYEFVDGLRVPRWFGEGYAEWASGGWGGTEGWKLRFALARGGASLDSLTLSWPRNRADAEGAYMLSATAIEYLVTSTSDRALGIFLERWRTDENFEGAFRATFGVTTAQFENDWRKWVKRRYGWLFVLSHSAVFWALLTLSSFAMWRVRHRRNRLNMARLRAREIPELPAYWLMPGDSGGTGLATKEGGQGAPPVRSEPPGR